MNFAARHLLPPLSIDLNEGGEALAGAGGGGEGGAGGEGDAAAAGSSGDGKGADSSGDAAAAAAAKSAAAGDEATKAAAAAKAATAELGKSYEKWTPTLPKGMPFDAKGFGDFRQAFIDAGLKPEQSQKLVDVFAKAELGRMQAVAADLKKESDGWAAAIKSDKELAGANGEKLEKSQADATRAMQKFATPAFRKLLTDSRLASHPEMIRVFARAGAGMAEDSTDKSKAGGGKPSSVKEQRVKRWPNSKELHTD